MELISKWSRISLLLLSLNLVVNGNPEPPVQNYMSNLYNSNYEGGERAPIIYDHHHIVHDDQSVEHLPAVPVVGGGYEEQSPYQLVHPPHSSSEEKDHGHKGGYERERPSYHHGSSEEKSPPEHSNRYGDIHSYHEEEEPEIRLKATSGWTSPKGYSSGPRPRPSHSYSKSPSKKGYKSYSSYTSKGSGPGSRPSKYSYSKGSPYESEHEEEHEEPISHEEESPPTYSSYKSPPSPSYSSYKSPKGPSPTYSSYKSSSPPLPTVSYGSSPTSGYKTLDDISSGGGYSPYSGYVSDGWQNTMKGGYDDYGYNVDNMKSPGYKGPSKSFMYSSPEYSGPSNSEHAPPPKEYSYSSSSPPVSPDSPYSYGPPYGEEDVKLYSPYTSSKSIMQNPPSRDYGKSPYFSSYKYGSPSSSKGPPSSKGSYYGRGYPPKKYYKGSKGPYGSPYGGKGPSYSGKKATRDLSNYYRTRSGGVSRRTPILRAMKGYRHKYSTIGNANSVHKRSRNPLELENGPSEDYGPYNWENDGWTITH